MATADSLFFGGAGLRTPALTARGTFLCLVSTSYAVPPEARGLQRWNVSATGPPPPPFRPTRDCCFALTRAAGGESFVSVEVAGSNGPRRRWRRPSPPCRVRPAGFIGLHEIAATGGGRTRILPGSAMSRSAVGLRRHCYFADGTRTRLPGISAIELRLHKVHLCGLEPPARRRAFPVRCKRAPTALRRSFTRSCWPWRLLSVTTFRADVAPPHVGSPSVRTRVAGAAKMKRTRHAARALTAAPPVGLGSGKWVPSPRLPPFATGEESNLPPRRIHAVS